MVQGLVVWLQRYAGPGMVQWSCNRDMQDQGWYRVWAGNRDLLDQGWNSGLVTEIFRTRDGTVFW